MAAARQNEMKVSITVVATNTFTAGRRMLGMDEDIYRNARERKTKNLAQWGRGICDQTARQVDLSPRTYPASRRSRRLKDPSLCHLAGPPVAGWAPCMFW
jgi:hypothetical protein